MAYDRSNVFAQMLNGDIPVDAVYEDDYALAFQDIHPAAPVHILVIPKGDFTSFDDFMQQADTAMITGFFKAVQQVAASAGLQEDGYRLISNHGRNASQTVGHFHVHILGGRPLGGLVASDHLVR